ncbi:PRC-barrel domain-containing protein [Pseudonocardia sichuanensis]
MSDLLDRRVVDASGRHVGRVREVRLVPDAANPDTYRMDGLVVGRLLGGDRLGYGRTVAAPWLLARLFAAIRRTQHHVRWDEVERVGATIELNRRLDELRPET